MVIFQRRHRANVISGFRLFFLPVIAFTGLLGQREVFVGLFAVQLFLDAVDGVIARRMHIESDFGRRLDTVVDLAIWLSGLAVFLGLIWDEFGEIFSAYPHLFIIPTITSILMYVTAYRYLHTFAAIHLYSGKLTSGLILLLMLTLLLDHFYPLLAYLTASVGVLYHLEAIAIYITQKEQTDENVTSLLQVRRKHSKI